MRRLAQPELTKTNREVIALAINTRPAEERKNATKITYAVSELLAQRYGKEDENGDYYFTEGSEYQLSRAGMRTTLDIKEKVQLFLRKACC